MPIKNNTFSFTMRPLEKGLNKSTAPNDIDGHEASDLMNVRFEKGRIQFRSGFHFKYFGMGEALLWLDLIYSQTEAQVLGIGHKGLYMADADKFTLVPFYDPDQDMANPIFMPYYSMDPLTQYLGVDVGFGQFQFQVANGGALFPSSTNYESLTVISNGNASNNGGIIVVAYTEAGPQAERIRNAYAPSMGRSIAIWDGRIFVGGNSDADGAFQDNARVTWSAKGILSDWENGGNTIIGDSPDWIQAMRKLGEYLIVYKERSIFIGRQTFLVDPPVRFDPAPGQGIGLAAPNSIGDLGEEHIFLGWDNVYMFSMQRIEDVGSQIKDELFYGKNGVLPEFLGGCTGIIAEEFDEYWLFVPTGKWPSDGTSDKGVKNLLTDALCADSTAWTTDGTLTNIDGKIGVDALQTTGTYIETTVTIESTGLHSSTIWLKGTVNGQEATLKLGTESRTIELSTTFQRYLISANLTGNTVLRVESSGNILVDAAHVVRIEEVEEKYTTGLNNEITFGYLNAFDEPEEVPLVADAIGPWTPDTCWAYNYSENSWTVWRLPMTGFGYDTILAITTIGDLIGTIEEQTWRFDEKRITEFAPTNLLAQPDGQIYEMVRGLTVDYGGVLDRPFLAHWTSKDFDLSRPDIEKTVSKFTIHHETSHAPREVTIGVSTNSGLDWEEQVVTINEGRTFTDAFMFVTGPSVMFRISAVSPGFFITGITIKLIPRGETNLY